MRVTEQPIHVLDARPLPGREVEPGVLAEVSEEGAVIGAAGGAILARKLQPEGAAAAPAHEVSATLRLKPGTRLLNPSRQD
jgi:methionyl-tRNA formyltransferase